eukprot:scaffold64441_cov45-Attheya_sp.AAC.2
MLRSLFARFVRTILIQRVGWTVCCLIMFRGIFVLHSISTKRSANNNNSSLDTLHQFVVGFGLGFVVFSSSSSRRGWIVRIRRVMESFSLVTVARGLILLLSTTLGAFLVARNNGLLDEALCHKWFHPVMLLGIIDFNAVTGNEERMEHWFRNFLMGDNIVLYYEHLAFLILDCMLEDIRWSKRNKMPDEILSCKSDKADGKYTTFHALHHDYMKYVNLEEKGTIPMTVNQFLETIVRSPVIEEDPAEETIRMYEGRLYHQIQKYGANHALVAKTLETLGYIYNQRGDTNLALEYLQDVLNIFRTLLGNDHLYVSKTMTYIGGILYDKHMFAEAIELLTYSLQIQEKSHNCDHKTMTLTLFCLGLCQHQYGNYDAAIVRYSETIVYWQRPGTDF